MTGLRDAGGTADVRQRCDRVEVLGWSRAGCQRNRGDAAWSSVTEDDGDSFTKSGQQVARSVW